MSPLEVWYDRIGLADDDRLPHPTPSQNGFVEQIAAKAQRRIGEYLFPKITTEVDGRHRLVDQPPVLYHLR